MGDPQAPPDGGIVGQITRAMYGNSLDVDPDVRAKHLRRSEYRQRLITVQQTAIALAYVVVALLVCAIAYEVWRILHEVTP